MRNLIIIIIVLCISFFLFISLAKADDYYSYQIGYATQLENNKYEFQLGSKKSDYAAYYGEDDNKYKLNPIIIHSINQQKISDNEIIIKTIGEDKFISKIYKPDINKKLKSSFLGLKTHTGTEHFIFGQIVQVTKDVSYDYIIVLDINNDINKIRIDKTNKYMHEYLIDCLNSKKYVKVWFIKDTINTIGEFPYYAYKVTIFKK